MVCTWERKLSYLREKREHVSKLPGVKIPEAIDITTDLERSLRDADVAGAGCSVALYQKHL